MCVEETPRARACDGAGAHAGGWTRSRRSSSGPTSRTSSGRPSRRFSRTGWSAVWRSSRAIRSGRPRRSTSCSQLFVAHAPRARLADRDPRGLGATAAAVRAARAALRSTTATRRSSMSRPSHSRAARSARCGSPCTARACRLHRARAPAERARPPCARANSSVSHASWRGGAAGARLRDGARPPLPARRPRTRCSSSGLTPTGDVAGFLHFAVSPAGRRCRSRRCRASGSPNGFNEWLICETIAWARDNGYEHVSLNFAPFAGAARTGGGADEPARGPAARPAHVEGPLPARQPAPLQPQVRTALGAAVRRLREAPRPAARRCRRAWPPRRTCPSGADG